MASSKECFPIICIGQMKAGTTWLYELFGYFTDIWRAPVKELHFLDVYERVGSTTVDQRLSYDVNHNNEALLELSEGIWRPELNAFIEQFSLLKGHLLSDAAIRQLKWWNLFLFDDRDWDWYQRLFLWPYPKKFADITPHYDTTCSDETISLLARKMPNVRVIFLLRNPLSRLVSHFGLGKKHNAPVAKLISDWEFFQKVFKNRDNDDGVRAHFEGMLADSQANDNLKKWAQHIPKSQIFVGFLDDIVNHQHKFISVLADFVCSDFVLPSSGFLPPVNEGAPLQVDSRVIEWLANWSEVEAKALSDCFGELPEWWAWDIGRLKSALGNGVEEWSYKGIAPPGVSFSTGTLE